MVILLSSNGCRDRSTNLRRLLQASASLCRSRHYPAFYARQGTDGASEHISVPVEAQPSNVPASVQAQQPEVKFVDVGCGFGGLLVKLAPLYPDTLMLGMELRDKVWRRRKALHCLTAQHLLSGSLFPECWLSWCSAWCCRPKLACACALVVALDNCQAMRLERGGSAYQISLVLQIPPI